MDPTFTCGPEVKQSEKANCSNLREDNIETLNKRQIRIDAVKNTAVYQGYIKRVPK